jgi:hypothetical protein
MEVVNPGDDAHRLRTWFWLSARRWTNTGCRAWRQGLINIKVTERNGRVVGIKQVTEADELMIATTAGNLIRLPVRSWR